MRKKTMIVLGVVVLVVVVALCCLVVPGGWVSGVDQLTADSVVTASQYQHMDEENATEITLTQQQTEELRQLLESTVFFRRFTSEVRSQEKLTHYDFTVVPDGGGDPVYVRCAFGSGSYVTVVENGSDTALKPVFPGWQEKLEEILAT